jgi:hypothetical protein
MRTVLILFLLLCRSLLHCAAQQSNEKTTFYVQPSDTVEHRFVGYDEGRPVFCTNANQQLNILIFKLL